MKRPSRTEQGILRPWHADFGRGHNKGRTGGRCCGRGSTRAGVNREVMARVAFEGCGGLKDLLLLPLSGNFTVATNTPHAVLLGRLARGQAAFDELPRCGHHLRIERWPPR